MVTESQARMDEYTEGRKLSQKAIIKEINDEKDKEIKQLKREKEWLISKIQRMSSFSGQKDYVKGVLLFEMQEALKE